jgi:decaprenylphospho-beta-D-ribofuranose 2-oxidase
VLRLLGGAHEAVLDETAATVRVPAGVSLDDLLRVIVPRGFFVPVTPGTRFVTIGGAIASDVHGKNHHVEGSFGNHVLSLDLLLADGSTATVSPSQQPDLFWATIGGMGLTGAILTAHVALLRIESSLVSVDTRRLGNLDDLLAEMSATDVRYRYSVAWLDLLAKGASLGRSVITSGDHAPANQLDARHAVDPLRYGPRVLASVPPVPVSGVLNRFTVAAFNEVWFRKAPKHRDGELQSIATFFHPLDMVGVWNRVYGPRGMMQYQFVLPFGEEATLTRVLELLSGKGAPSFVTVLKRFGPGNPAPLSFPAAGWTLALDVPCGLGGLDDIVHTLDRMVLGAGGRHYLAKDAHASAATIRAGYPRLAEWQAVRDRVDPHGVWVSDLARRLELVGPTTASQGDPR